MQKFTAIAEVEKIVLMCLNPHCHEQLPAGQIVTTLSILIKVLVDSDVVAIHIHVGKAVGWLMLM